MDTHVGSPTALLQVSGVGVRFGGIVALDRVSFDVGRGQICGLIGPNGAGKTTLFNCISGIYRYGEGEILFEGRKLAGTPRHKMIDIGLGRTFQNLALFRTLSVRDNVLVGAHHLARTGRRPKPRPKTPRGGGGCRGRRRAGRSGTATATRHRTPAPPATSRRARRGSPCRASARP